MEEDDAGRKQQSEGLEARQHSISREHQVVSGLEAPNIRKKSNEGWG